MSTFVDNKQGTKVYIPEVELQQPENYMVYQIAVEVGPVSWRVPHRYKDFVELHDKLVADHGVTKDLLPPKKVIGNRDPVFVEKRRSALEMYLASVLTFLLHTMPRELAIFLDFHKYDILFILQEMAVNFFENGDEHLRSSKHYVFTPLQLHAISERLKQPCPPREMVDKKYDFSHVLDFCYQLNSLSILGSSSVFGNSNIVYNNLLFELSSFKAVDSLYITNLPVANIYGVGLLRENLISLSAHHCRLERISHVLLCDDVHKEASSASEPQQAWKKMTCVNLSNNEISEIDASVKLMPRVEQLFLNNNRLSSLDNLTLLPHLAQLHLSGNCFSSLNELHRKIGNVVHLDLSENQIVSLEGFSKLYSLETLNLASNQISDLDQVKHICNLPCLENVVLTGNPLAIVVDYRVKVLEQFGARATLICLDNEISSQKEHDTVAVLQALRIAKEGRPPPFVCSSTP
ncbi:nischarin [Thrips palmi]|uniref:Nischarin n=1 Tax=Thrips palmi TaxID=161013 RepID=A0A6P8ZQ86_THRPL|nr:nischarin [Thrips palmi]